MKKENYKYQYEHWHQDTEESRAVDISDLTSFITAHGLWPLEKNARIFDVGCGMGRLLLAFRDRGYQKLNGIDIDEYQINVAQRENLDVKLIDAVKYFRTNKKHYDMVTMIDCLEHIEKNKQIKLLNKVYRSLSDDGGLIIRVPNALSPAFAYFRYIDFTHKTSYTIESLAYILKNAGFEYLSFRPAREETKEIIKLKTPFAKLLKAEFGIDDPILTSNILVVAYKSRAALDVYLKNAPKIEINYR